MFESLSFFLRFVGYVTPAMALFYFIAGMPARQAFVLGLWIGFILLFIEELIRSALMKPYRVSVDIGLPVILIDLGLIQSPDEWIPYRDAAKRRGVDFENFAFIAIRPDLFARSDAAEFSSAIKIEQSIWVFNLPERNMLVNNPSIYFRQVGDSYEFGLILPDEWEQRAKYQLTDASVTREWLGGERIIARVALARLPWKYFHKHVLAGWEPITLINPYALWKRRDIKWRNRLETLGWERAEVQPERIKHKYIEVSMQKI